MAIEKLAWRAGIREWAVVTIIVVPVGAWMAHTSDRLLPSALRALPLALVLSVTIGMFAWTLVPVAARVAAGWRPPARWALYLATMISCAVAGTAAASTVPFLAGVLDPPDILTLFLQNIAGTVPVTIVIGVALITIGTAKARLEATELTLKTQQLERERAEKLAAEAQLASLSSRVQPHFLFNTLNSISGLIREQPAQAEATVERLSSLLRSSLDGRETIPLAQELKLATDYLEIQRTRLGSRVRYELAAAGDVNGMIPPFAVQTLVENSIKHVAGKRAEGVAVRIGARHDSGRLVVSVTDDGPGFDPDAVTAGHGLDVLERRLRAVFGRTAAIEFERKPHAMTVHLRMPIA